MVDNKKKPLSDKTTAVGAMIKDSDLNSYLMARVAEGRDVRYIDAEGNTSSWITPETKTA